MSSLQERSPVLEVRSAILSDPKVILEDPQILQALVEAEDGARGGNVVDLRGLAMSRLEHRLGHLEYAHREVIAAAYDNVATTLQVHRAILAMLRPGCFETFLHTLDTEVRDCLRLHAIRLVLESERETPDCLLNRLDGTISVLPQGSVEGFAAQGRRERPLPFILREVTQGNVSVYGTAAAGVRSEAVVRIDLGARLAPGLLVLGAAGPDHFKPGHATDLLDLFARVFERLVRGWLA